MPEISKYELDLLKIHEKEYYDLLAKWNQMVDALKPLVKEIVDEIREDEYE